MNRRVQRQWLRGVLPAGCAILFVLTLFNTPVIPAEQSHRLVPKDFSQKYRPPIILAVDGFDKWAEIGGVEEWSGYLKEKLERPGPSNIKNLGADIEAFAWSGDTSKDTEAAVVSLKTTYIPALVAQAKRENRPFVIVAHSWGGVLAYRALHELEGQLQPGDVVLFLTLGTPLRAQNLLLRPYAKDRSLAGLFKGMFRKLQKPSSVSKWVNYWADNDNISGKIGEAINVEVPNVRRKDHSSYYIDYLEMIGAEIAYAIEEFFEPRSIGVAKSQPGSVPVHTANIAEYAMLSKTGAKWIYNYESEITVTKKSLGRQRKKRRKVSGTLTITNQGERSFEGRNTVLFVWKFERPRGNYSINYYLATSPEGITLVGREFQSRGASVKTRYDPPKLYGKNPLKIGAIWSYTGVAHKSGTRTASTPFTETRSILASENVAVPAGSFEAIKLVWLQPRGRTTTEWWAKGIGMVKTAKSSSNFIAELVSYSIPAERPKVAGRQEPQKGPGLSQTKERMEESTDPRAARSGQHVWSVQLAGAVQRQESALREAKRLKKKGYDAYVDTVTARGRTWYRVLVGNFATQDEAKRMLQTINRKERLAAVIARVRPAKQKRRAKLAEAEIPSKPPMVESETQQKKVAQTETPVWAKIRLKDGSVIIGKLESGTIQVKSTVGNLDLNASDILSLEGNEVRLKDGSIFRGRIVQGKIIIGTTQGKLTVEGTNVNNISVGSRTQVAGKSSLPEKRPTSSEAIFNKPSAKGTRPTLRRTIEFDGGYIKTEAGA